MSNIYGINVGDEIEVVFKYNQHNIVTRTVRIIHENELGFLFGLTDVIGEPALVEVSAGSTENIGQIVGYVNELKVILGMDVLTEALNQISDYRYKESPENSPLGAAHVDFAEASIDMKKIARGALNTITLL